MIVSVDAEKAFDRNQHLFMRKIMNKLGIEGKLVNLIQNIDEKSTANTILNVKDWVLSLEISSKMRMPTCPSYNITVGAPGH